MVAATGGIGVVYLLSFVLGFFGINIPLIHSTGTFGILFSLFVVAIAALNLVLDFDFIEEGAERGANSTISVDLDQQEVTGPDGKTIKFDINPFKKHCLLNGLDDIGLTMEKEDQINAFEEKQKITQPWT